MKFDFINVAKIKKIDFISRIQLNKSDNNADCCNKVYNVKNFNLVHSWT